MVAHPMDLPQEEELHKEGLVPPLHQGFCRDLLLYQVAVQDQQAT